MPLPPPFDLFIPLDDPGFFAPGDVLVIGLPLTSGSDAAPVPTEVPVPAEASLDIADAPDVEPPPPAFALPAEDAFPTLAELDAILAANAGDPASPDAAERAEAAALLGIDPASATDPALYAAALATLEDPDADQVLDRWLSEAEVGPPSSKWPDPSGDWQVG